MTKTPMIAALAVLAAAVPAMAQQPTAPTAVTDPNNEKVNIVIVYGEDACPPSQGDEIVVCARKGEAERYRIPEPLRGDPNKPSNQAWGERVRSMEYVGRSGTESCSPSGGGGAGGRWEGISGKEGRENRGAQWRSIWGTRWAGLRQQVEW